MSAAKRHTLKSALVRGPTTTPAIPPPSLLCPECEGLLRYLRSYIGGVSPRFAEQWDYFTCSCQDGLLQYRHRTRSLRKV